MASHNLYLEHPITGIIKKAPVGFSWTTFFFAMFPALFRGHWLGFILILAWYSASWFIDSDGIAAVWNLTVLLISSFSYNTFWTDHLIKEGFRPL